MKRHAFSFSDLIQDCRVEENTYCLQSKQGQKDLGLKIVVPSALFNSFPYNCSAYDFLQYLRKEIFQYGVIEFPGLPLNKQNYTVVMRAPKEHTYSSNPYLTEGCQSPHQDTPPYPTAFWLGAHRRYFATWLMTDLAMERFYSENARVPSNTVEALHRELVPESLQNNTAVLVNHTPGLILIDNSDRHWLYHAKTCKFDVVAEEPDYQSDSPMYSFNEIGLLHYIDSLDTRRGQDDRNQQELLQVKQFMENEGLLP